MHQHALVDTAVAACAVPHLSKGSVKINKKVKAPLGHFKMREQVN